MRRLPRIMLAVGASAAAGLGIACMAVAEQKEVIVGQMCDRTGPTQINGVVLCPASHDYYNLINSKRRGRRLPDQVRGTRPRVQGPASG